MAWRSVMISQPARLSLKQDRLLVEQEQGSASVPLEDIACIVLECPQISLTAPLLSRCAEHQVAVISVDDSHTPNGVFLPFTPHSRAVKVMRQQLAMSLPHKKRLWQLIVQQKIRNQAALLATVKQDDVADKLLQLTKRTTSGDLYNTEATAAQLYFPALFSPRFTRNDLCLANSGLNYGYAVIRAAIARSLVSYGFLPAFGLHHHSELNAFNLADDLIEPFRILVDRQVMSWPESERLNNAPLSSRYKAELVSLLHQDVARLDNDVYAGKSTILALIDATVMSLAQSMQTGNLALCLPSVEP